MDRTMTNVDRYTCALIADYAKKYKMTRFVKKLEKVTKCQNIDIENVTLKKVFQQYKNRAVKQDKYTEEQKYSCALIAKYSRNVGMSNFARILEEEIGCQGIELNGVTLVHVINKYKMTMNKAAKNLEHAFVMDYCERRGLHKTIKALEEKIGCQKIDLKGATLVDLIENYNSKFNCSRKRKAQNDILPKIKKPKLEVSQDQLFCCALIADYCRKTGLHETANALEQEFNCQKVDLKGTTLVDAIEKNKNPIRFSKERKIQESKVTSDRIKKPRIYKEYENHDEAELNKLVPIRSIFESKISIEDLSKKFPNTELAKTAKFILEENVQVKNSIAITSNLAVDYSGIEIRQRYPFLKTTKLSAKSYGPMSEEVVLVDQWAGLVEKVPIFVPEKFIKDIDLSHDFWIQKLIGAYLSQNFSSHRCASYLYKSFIRLKMRKGSFTQEEDEKLLAFYQCHKGKPTGGAWKKLAAEMERTSTRLQGRLGYIKGEQNAGNAPKRSRFTLAEDKAILEFVDEHFDISEADSLKTIVPKDFQPLAAKMQRGKMALGNRFNYTLLPIILGNIYCAVEVKWENDLLKYIIESRVNCISDVDWKDLLTTWPYLTRPIITRVLDRARQNSNIHGLLFQQIDAYVHRIPTNRSSPAYVHAHKLEIVKIHDDLKGKKLQKI